MASARILYLDDEEPLVFIVKRMLERLGHQVAGFSNADAALAAFSAAPDTFHLVLTDMSMPGMNGIDFATAVIGVQAGCARRDRVRLHGPERTQIAPRQRACSTASASPAR